MIRRHGFPLAVLGFCLVASASACGEGRSATPAPHLVLTPEGGQLVLPFEAGDQPVLAVARDRTSGRFRRLGLPEAHASAHGVRVEAVALGEDAFLWVSGCRELLLPAVPSPTPLRLAYGPRVRLRLVTDGEIPSDPYELRLTFTWRGAGVAPDALLRHEFPSAAPEGWFPVGGPASPSHCTVAITGSPETVVRFSEPGRYRVTWMFTHVRRIDGATMSTGVGDSDAGFSIDVKDGVEDQTIDLELPGRVLRDARQSLGR